MKPNEKVEAVLRPEDLDITIADQESCCNGRYAAIPEVDYQIMVHDEEGHEWKINSIHKTKVGEKVGITFDPEDIHIMRYHETEAAFDARLDSYEGDDEEDER